MSQVMSKQMNTGSQEYVVYRHEQTPSIDSAAHPNSSVGDFEYFIDNANNCTPPTTSNIVSSTSSKVVRPTNSDAAQNALPVQAKRVHFAESLPLADTDEALRSDSDLDTSKKRKMDMRRNAVAVEDKGPADTPDGVDYRAIPSYSSGYAIPNYGSGYGMPNNNYASGYGMPNNYASGYGIIPSMPIWFSANNNPALCPPPPPIVPACYPVATPPVSWPHYNTSVNNWMASAEDVRRRNAFAENNLTISMKGAGQRSASVETAVPCRDVFYEPVHEDDRNKSPRAATDDSKGKQKQDQDQDQDQDQEKVRKEVQKKFRCDMCKYATKTACSLKQHKMHKHSIGVKWFSCNHGECNYRAKSRCNLQSHVREVHGIGTKWYYCGIDNCTHKAKRKTAIKHHRLSIHGRLYKCPVPDCGFNSKLKYDMSMHVRGMHHLKWDETTQIMSYGEETCRVIK